MKTGKEMDNLISQKLKRSKGITIIALVVTIIVLIILAGVSISIVLREGGVLREVEISKDLTERKNTIELAQLDIAGEQTDNKGQLTEEKFKDILAKYFNYDPKSKLPEDLSTLVLTTKDGKYNDILASEIYSGKFSKNTNSKTAENIKEARKLVDSNTEITSDDDVKVTIPAGFTIPEDSPTNAKEGIIVTDSINESTGKSNGSEFVWIPVNSNLTVVGTKKAMAKESKAEGYEGKDGKTNYEGVLYDFEGTKSTEKSSYGQGTNEYREPDIVNWYDCSVM